MRIHHLTPLFCKPNIFTENHQVLFKKDHPELNAEISFRSLNLQTDLTLIHQWVNMDYSKEYWQMNGQFSQLYAIYQCMELNPYSHSFIGLLNGEIICQFDVYSVFADELRDHVPCESHDCGFHLLMSPNRNPIPGLTKAIVETFLEYYFSFPKAVRMYAEPDIFNLKSIDLLKKCGFVRKKMVKLSYKKAYVYCLERPEEAGSRP